MHEFHYHVQQPTILKLPTHGHDNIHIRHILAAHARLGSLNHAHNVEPVDNLAEHDVFAIEKGCRHGGDEELGAVGSWAGILGLSVG